MAITWSVVHNRTWPTRKLTWLEKTISMTEKRHGLKSHLNDNTIRPPRSNARIPYVQDDCYTHQLPFMHNICRCQCVIKRTQTSQNTMEESPIPNTRQTEQRQQPCEDTNIEYYSQPGHQVHCRLNQTSGHATRLGHLRYTHAMAASDSSLLLP